MTELVKPPDLNQARVNKCLIALVNRKLVRKDNSTVCLSLPRSLSLLVLISSVSTVADDDVWDVGKRVVSLARPLLMKPGFSSFDRTGVCSWRCGVYDSGV